ncbi:hypothetical protein HD806DRAFT_539541 [Xylariaceae sp. AK1471]|nr:hypothetical protein HD806DRAFT_539541 [Xylariaceae sp. AK1471]
MTRKQRREEVAVIGAGASGLAVARRLMAEGLKVTVYERQSDPGGVWNFSSDPGEMFSTPMYENLITNFPRHLMEFADQKWPSGASLFPEHKLVQEYLRKYSDTVHVNYGREVFNLHGLTTHFKHKGKKWRVDATNSKSGQEWRRNFDAVVVATGTFDGLFEPDYPGLEDWRDTFPDSVLHSRSYRAAAEFSGKNVLIVGNSASGLDISLQIVGAAKKSGFRLPSQTEEAITALKQSEPSTALIQIVALLRQRTESSC